MGKSSLSERSPNPSHRRSRTPPLPHPGVRPSIATSEDEDLVVAMARGDRLALSALYRRHAPALLALGNRLLQDDRREAEDLVHDVFVELWKAAGDYDPARGTVRAWMLVRIRSRALDRLRCARQRCLVLTGETAEVEVSAPQSVVSEGRRVVGLLDGLSTHHRKVIELGYFEDLSSEEVARRLSIPVGTVKSRTAAAIAELRRRLGVTSLKETH